MRKLIMGLILASTALASPALAHDDAWYIEADGGVVFMDDMVFTVDHLSNGLGLQAGATAAVLDTKMGYDFGGIVGYDFGPFRLEGEASYRSANANTMTVATGSTNTPFFPASPATGKVNSLSFMVNGLIDLGPDDGPQFFAGGGVGYAHAKVQATTVPSSSTTFTLDGADEGFAWQLLAGVRYPLSRHVDIGLKYRYFNQNHINLPASYTFSGEGTFTTGDITQSRLRSHSALLTLTYNFLPPPPPPVEAEEVPPAPPPPPEPMPVPPPPPPVCNKGPYIVFFDWDKSDITPEAAATLDSAISAYGNCANVPIMLAGYTDRSGSNTYNQGLSERRNASVTSYLTAHGIPGGAISSQAFGETNNRVPTADGVKELQNRRVEITYGPGSGM